MYLIIKDPASDRQNVQMWTLDILHVSWLVILMSTCGMRMQQTAKIKFVHTRLQQFPNLFDFVILSFGSNKDLI